MTAIYTFIQDVTPEDWSALRREFKAGETVKRYIGYTYGLDRDDLIYMKRETVPCLEIGEEQGFFTVPVEYLTEDGNPVRGDYVFLNRGGKASE